MTRQPWKSRSQIGLVHPKPNRYSSRLAPGKDQAYLNKYVSNFLKKYTLSVAYAVLSCLFGSSFGSLFERISDDRLQYVYRLQTALGHAHSGSDM